MNQVKKYVYLCMLCCCEIMVDDIETNLGNVLDVHLVRARKLLDFLTSTKNSQTFIFEQVIMY